MEAFFKMWIEIRNPEELATAAREKAIADGIDPEDAARDFTAKPEKLGACLVMLLDPSTLPGCKILDSVSEIC